MHAAGKLSTRPRGDLAIPAALDGLTDLALNLRWTWDHGQASVLEWIDPVAWQADPDVIAQIGRTSPDRWSALATDPAFRRALDLQERRLAAYLEAPPESGGTVGYFCAEYGLHPSIPLYAGGLGILAGDTLKAASDRGMDVVAVGLLYRHGGFHQSFDAEGNQVDDWPERSPDSFPIRRAAVGGEELTVSVPIADRVVSAAVWVAQVGRIPLVLLETDVPENAAADRQITGRLYAGDRQQRLEQEIVLGVGGLRALTALGVTPRVLHLNEGHAALLLLERARVLRPGATSASEALARAGAEAAFTIHTPIAAGNESFDRDLLLAEVGSLAAEIGLDPAALTDLGGRPDGTQDRFDLTAFALRLAARVNGVSQAHARTATATWTSVRGQPIEAVTNGVHAPTWLGPDMQRLTDPTADELWAAHLAERARLLADPALIGRIPDGALLIGFARRFATYKRASLILAQPERLRALLDDPDRPVRILMAGKAHPADAAALQLLADVRRATSKPPFEDRIIFLPDYGMALAGRLVAGVDLWLNTPRKPLEASGTSGMKAALNGVPNLSIRDGWWEEGYRGTNGWAIGGTEPSADAEDADELYRLLEEDVVPAYFTRNAEGLPEAWLAVMASAREVAMAEYTTDRMLDDAERVLYGPIRAAALVAANPRG